MKPEWKVMKTPAGDDCVYQVYRIISPKGPMHSVTVQTNGTFRTEKEAEDWAAVLNEEKRGNEVPDINVGNNCSKIPNSSDCVSRQAAIDAINDLPNCPNGYSGTYDKATIISELEALPSSQPEIILCKDCIHRWHSGGRSVAGKWIRIYRCKRHGIEINLNDFCSYAERKKDGSD